LPAREAEDEILACCGSRAWARAMVGQRPISGEVMLLSKSDEIWRALSEADWNEAFRSHPRIGESQAQPVLEPVLAAPRSRQWSAAEQSQASSAEARVKMALAEGNREYEKRFRRTFIVSATGKSAGEILEILSRRLKNDFRTELYEAVREQEQITRIRLQRWLRE
jgi:2-oxo-4-hydroxy-4-carboxy-5-ureidoimidazoline decarboxylase